MSYLPRIDEGACIAQGDCVDIAPQVFQLDDRASVIGTGPDELLMQAAENCPVEAIALLDEDSGEQVYP